VRQPARFYFDHNMHKSAAGLMRSRGHEATSALELGTDTAKDDAHLLIAVRRAAILVTHNRKDFELLSDAWKRWTQAWQLDRPHNGVLVLPQPMVPPQIVDLLERFVTEDLLARNQFYEWKPSHGWTRRSEPPNF
jgi:hypothetical protein